VGLHVGDACGDGISVSIGVGVWWLCLVVVFVCSTRSGKIRNWKGGRGEKGETLF